MKKLNSFEMLTNENANDMYSRLNILVEEVNGLGLTQISQPDVVRKILSVLQIEKYGHIVIVLHQMDLSITTPTQILGKINAYEMYMHINDKNGSSYKNKDLALKASQEKKGKTKIQVEEESSSDDDVDTNIALMLRKTIKMLKKLYQEGIKFDSRKKNYFSLARESPYPRWIATIVENLVILLTNATSPRKTNSRARKMMKVMMRRKKRSSSRRKKATTRGFIKRRMEKHILFVIGSPTLNPQATLQVKKMMKRSPPSLGISLHHHHHLHILHTYASWLKVNGRYKMKMSLLKIVIVIMMMNMLLPLMMN
jgi:hypothetical protein